MRNSMVFSKSKSEIFLISYIYNENTTDIVRSDILPSILANVIKPSVCTNKGLFIVKSDEDNLLYITYNIPIQVVHYM